jgi:hypothetical protein
MLDLSGSRWKYIPTRKLVGFFIVFTAFVLFVIKSEPGFIMILDDANLVFHEAGHPIVGLFSQRLETYGGTMGQLTFPIVLAVCFWRRNEAISFAVSVIWFFENWLNIAAYMADARAKVLPLVGGGDHDWARIFGRWDVLDYDTQIAAYVRTTAWVGIITVCAWVIWVWWSWRDREIPPEELEIPVPAHWRR